MKTELLKVRDMLKQEKLDAFLVTNPFNRRFVTGFSGSTGYAWVTKDSAAFLTDFRYIEQAKEQCVGWEIINVEDYHQTINSLVEKEKITTIGVEGDHITVNQYFEWKNKLKAEPKLTEGWFKPWRMVKTPEEIGTIAKAAQIGDQAFAELLPLIKSGVTERTIAAELEYIMHKLGAEGVSFAPIVASGPRSALPHARPGERILFHGDFVVLDFGCIYKGYCSDMTRTVVIGEPEEKHLLIYDLVLRAQMAALEAITPGKTGEEIDRVAREIITDGGYGQYFGHNLGHGVGLEIHEEPRLSPKGQVVLEPGMVITVEPGIYIPGWGGVRIEDLVVVTETGCDILSSTFKELHITE